MEPEVPFPAAEKGGRKGGEKGFVLPRKLERKMRLEKLAKTTMLTFRVDNIDRVAD